MVMNMDQPTNDFDEHEHGEDTSSAAYDAERERVAEIKHVAQRHPGLASALISEQLAWRHLRNAVMEAIGFLDSQADADHSDATGRGEPNYAMSLRNQLTESLTRYAKVK